MWGVITGFFGGLWAKVALVGAILAVVGAVLLGARSAGRAEAKLEQREKDIEQIKRQRLAASRSPVDRDDVADSMRDGTF